MIKNRFLGLVRAGMAPTLKDGMDLLEEVVEQNERVVYKGSLCKDCGVRFGFISLRCMYCGGAVKDYVITEGRGVE